MKNEIRMALLCLAAASAPAFAQSASPQCGYSNYDGTLNAFTVVNPVVGAVNQQCFVTVHASGSAPDKSGQYAAPTLFEGTYAIELVGGGGGGGGGASKDQGGGGGGAGAVPSQTVQYLSPGVYKLTLGTGGEGGAANGGRTGDGNPTSLTNAATGQLIAGFAGADTWTQHSQAAGDGHGGVAAAGGSSGGSGGDSGSRSEEKAQAGGAAQTGGYSGMPGLAGGESGRSAKTDAGNVIQANAGGGGGASIGSGGTGESAKQTAATEAGAGSRGGHGLIRLTLKAAAPVALAPAPAIVAPAPLMQKYSLSTDALFGFGQSTLRPAGEAKLDDLVGKLKGVDIDRITDTGHADRIGSSELNQRLSLSRAETVKAYLVSKGVPPGRISVAGRGETQPLTSSDDCKGPATAKVIACLAPDRRVDIEVSGSSKLAGAN